MGGVWRIYERCEKDPSLNRNFTTLLETAVVYCLLLIILLTQYYKLHDKSITTADADDSQIYLSYTLQVSWPIINES